MEKRKGIESFEKQEKKKKSKILPSIVAGIGIFLLGQSLEAKKAKAEEKKQGVDIAKVWSDFAERASKSSKPEKPKKFKDEYNKLEFVKILKKKGIKPENLTQEGWEKLSESIGNVPDLTYKTKGFNQEKVEEDLVKIEDFIYRAKQEDVIGNDIYDSLELNLKAYWLIMENIELAKRLKRQGREKEMNKITREFVAREMERIQREKGPLKPSGRRKAGEKKRK